MFIFYLFNSLPCLGNKSYISPRRFLLFFFSGLPSKRSPSPGPLLPCNFKFDCVLRGQRVDHSGGVMEMEEQFFHEQRGWFKKYLHGFLELSFCFIQKQYTLIKCLWLFSFRISITPEGVKPYRQTWYKIVHCSYRCIYWYDLWRDSCFQRRLAGWLFLVSFYMVQWLAITFWSLSTTYIINSECHIDTVYRYYHGVNVVLYDSENICLYILDAVRS